MKSLILPLLLICPSSYSFLGQDTALLVQLISTTASQLNELERLVSNTEKYTKKMREYNELMQDEYFKAERIAYLAEEVAAKKEIENLNDLNGAIRNLKYSMSDLKSLMREYSKIKENEKQTIARSKVKKKLIRHKDKRAKAQVGYALRAQSTGRATQLTAQNTALIYETQLEMQDSQLDILNELSTANRLAAEEREDKRLKELKNKSNYKLTKVRP
jgi:uncharacterized protein YoxC